jgi:hypothetical protein
MLLADLGGISSSLLFVMRLITAFLSKRIFMRDILNKLFMIKSRKLLKDFSKNKDQACVNFEKENKNNFEGL